MSDRHSATNEDTGEVQSYSGDDSWFDVDDLLNVALFEIERQQVLNARNIDRHSPFRQESIDWILERHRHFRFSPATAYRALWYFDWHMSNYAAPVQEQSYLYRLLAVACLSVAAKKEETQARIPSAVDLQGIRTPRSFPAELVMDTERVVMERLVMNRDFVTPVDFQDYFTELLPPSPVPRRTVHISVTFNYLVMCTIRAGDFRRFYPSEVAAAAVILAAGERDAEFPDSFYERVNRVTVTICREQMQGYVTVFCPCSDCAGRMRRLLDATNPITGDELWRNPDA